MSYDFEKKSGCRRQYVCENGIKHGRKNRRRNYVKMDERLVRTVQNYEETGEKLLT